MSFLGAGLGVTPGASGNLLISNGTDWTSAAPNGAISGMVLLASATASGSASLDFTGLSSTYKAYKFIGEDIIAATNAVSLYMRYSQNNGSSYLADSNYRWGSQGIGVAASTGNQGVSLTPQINMTSSTTSNTATKGIGFELTLFDPANTASHKSVMWMLRHWTAAGATDLTIGHGTYTANTTAVNAVQFLMGSGNITSGTIHMYGLRAT